MEYKCPKCNCEKTEIESIALQIKILFEEYSYDGMIGCPLCGNSNDEIVLQTC